MYTDFSLGVPGQGQGRPRRAAMGNGDERHWHGLGLLACGLALEPVQVQALLATADVSPLGGAAPASTRAVLVAAGDRPAQTAPRLLLPALEELAFEQRMSLHAAMAAHAVAHLRYSPAGQPSNLLKPMGMVVVSAIEDARVERLLMESYPGVRRWFEAHLSAEPDASDLGFRAFLARLDRILFLAGGASGNHWVSKGQELFERTAKEHGLQDYAAFRAIASILANDLGQMRVRMDPQHYVVPGPYRDDNSYLWRHPESEPGNEALALEQSGARPPPASAGSGAAQDGAVPQALEAVRYAYPEWDCKIERLKADWCTVVEQPAAGRGAADEQARMPLAALKGANLRMRHARQLDRRHRLRRQWEGDELDLNAAIEVQVSRRLNLQPDPRLFLRAGCGPRPTSLLVLMDVSVSVNRRAVNGLTLLDLEKQAALLLAQSAIQGLDRLAIHAFSSNTRAQVNYDRVLDFGQPCTTPVADAIRALQGRYSTRLGAALRHASNLLLSEPEGQRTMLVITDGEPSDVDVHDSRYLTEDARQAVLMARQAGIRVCCLAVDEKADGYVSHIFGWRNFGIADDARSLPQRLTHMSARLAAGR